MLEYISCIIAEKERATMLSLESQLRTLFIIIFAPLMGVVADLYSLWIMFVFAFLSMFVLYLFTVIER